MGFPEEKGSFGIGGPSGMGVSCDWHPLESGLPQEWGPLRNRGLLGLGPFRNVEFF